MNRKSGLLSLLLAGLLYGSFGVWIRFLNTEIPMFRQVLFRSVIALIVALVFLYFRTKFHFNLSQIPKSRLLLFSPCVPFAFIFYNLSVLNTKISVAIFSFYIGSLLFSYLISRVVFKEKVTKDKILALVFVFIGFIFITYPISLITLNLGFVAGFISGVFDAISNSFRKSFYQKVDKFFIVSLTMVSVLLVCGILIPLFGEKSVSFSSISLFSMLILLFFGFILVFVNYLLLKGFGNFDLGLGTIDLASEIFFSIIFGLLLLGEKPTLNEFIGGVFIMIAVVIPNIKSAKLRIGY